MCMVGQAALACVPSPALFARIGLLARVRAQVAGQVGLVCEPSLALFARIGLLARVRAQVAGQVALGCEPSLALFARIGLLARVRAHVDGQVALGCGYVPALVTRSALVGSETSLRVSYTPACAALEGKFMHLETTQAHACRHAGTQILTYTQFELAHTSAGIQAIGAQTHVQTHTHTHRHAHTHTYKHTPTCPISTSGHHMHACLTDGYTPRSAASPLSMSPTLSQRLTGI
jgi:hypothetical protein